MSETIVSEQPAIAVHKPVHKERAGVVVSAKMQKNHRRQGGSSGSPSPV